MKQIETLRREHTCPDCSGSFMPVSHPATTAAEADESARTGTGAVGPFNTSAAVDLAALRSLLWYRGDLAGELA